MQQFHSEPESHSVYAAPGASQYAAPPTPLDAAEQQRLQESIEDYLDRVCRPLMDALPYAARQELRREIAQHLNALVQAYRESGYAPALATEKALEKFGPPHLVAQKWNPVPVREGLPRRMERWFARQWQGMAVMLFLCGVAGACGLLLRHAALSPRGLASHSQPIVSTVSTPHPPRPLSIATLIEERVTLTELAQRQAALDQARAELMYEQVASWHSIWRGCVFSSWPQRGRGQPLVPPKRFCNCEETLWCSKTLCSRNEC